MQNKILDIYTQAFTHPSFHVTNNYQVYEQIGDLSINKFFVWYFYERFPILQKPSGVKVVARLRIKYGSKDFLSSLAKSLHFEQYILKSEDVRLTDSIYEDVLVVEDDECL